MKDLNNEILNNTDSNEIYTHSLEKVSAINISNENSKAITYDCYMINVKSGDTENHYKVQSLYIHENAIKNFPSWVTVLYWNSLESDTDYELRFKINPNQLNLLKKPGFIAEIKNIADKLVATSECDLVLSKNPIKTSVYVAPDMIEVVYEEDFGE